ncbi:MAG: type II toxin-antitoxin system MqsA family antitoxin [Candidatus Kapabacteria bacterium]|jgi:YgiT-type zinc finger domain-containing protein|nr:type II toxin-antitoxin system MqsA family antitoxin [Candidatus Kapabacteria bacterium]
MTTPHHTSCPLCGGTVEKGFTTFSADIQGRLFVARHVPANVCGQCGEEWIENSTAQELERLAMTALEARREVEIVSLAA